MELQGLVSWGNVCVPTLPSPMPSDPNYPGQPRPLNSAAANGSLVLNSASVNAPSVTSVETSSGGLVSSARLRALLQLQQEAALLRSASLRTGGGGRANADTRNSSSRRGEPSSRSSGARRPDASATGRNLKGVGSRQMQASLLSSATPRSGSASSTASLSQSGSLMAGW